jgi:hypothetical protein
MTTAIVNEPISAISHTGSGITLPAGAYEIVDLDGVHETLAYVRHPADGRLVCIGRRDPAVTIVPGRASQ